MYSFKDAEKEILEFWDKDDTYKKVRKKNSNGEKFYMMDGPPYATGHIHMGTALNKIQKDIAMRSKRLQGFNVFDRAGYDTHGVPIEYQIEKEIGSKTKKDIEKYGVKNFIEKCKAFATKFIGVMNDEFKNLGVWMDFESPYMTLDNEYIEVIWDAFKKADEKGLLYLGKYPVHACSRCETAVAYNEIEYSKQDDNAIYLKFKLKNEKNKFLIIWTTTPWTLPGNTGIMANPEIEYSEIEISNGERWIIAKEKVSELMASIETGYTLKKNFLGKELKDLEYENPLSPNLKLKFGKQKKYKIILSSRYVNIEEGSGLVHCAPGHGKEDYAVGKENNLEMLCPVGINGILTEEAGKYKGKKARVVDEEIIEDLKKENFLVYQHKYSHDYPLCWRCKSPLLMVSMPQWFFKIDSIQKKLLKSNKEVNWIPKYMESRMNAWLEGISDWPISRSRYWGTPLPIWICEKCKNKEIIGSIKELEKKSGKKIKDVHKPEIDEVVFNCKCGGKMKRVQEVLDVWFDSGVSSWAALNYVKDKKLFEEFWPADLNLEGKDQVRGWWNSQIILSEIKFGKKPFKNILVHGMVLDLGKKKMSKSLGNAISPHEIIEKYGRDFLRYYFAKYSKGEDFFFNEEEFKKIRQFFVVLENVVNYANGIKSSIKGKIKEEDKWILSRLNSTISEVTGEYNKFNFPRVIECYEKFLLADLSRTYIKIVRERENEEIVKNILEEINLGMLKLISPVCPFMTEYLYAKYNKKKESIYLSEWPKTEKKKINKTLEEEFEKVLGVIEKGLAERDKAGIGLRWPLSSITISGLNINKKFDEIIKSQLNVKEIKKIYLEKIPEENIIKLDVKLTAELESEGYAREISRQIQAFRKNLGLEKIRKITLKISASENLMRMLSGQKKLIMERTNSEKFEIKNVTTDKERFKNNIEFKIKEERGVIGISF